MVKRWPRVVRICGVVAALSLGCGGRLATTESPAEGDSAPPAPGTSGGPTIVISDAGATTPSVPDASFPSAPSPEAGNQGPEAEDGSSSVEDASADDAGQSLAALLTPCLGGILDQFHVEVGANGPIPAQSVSEAMQGWCGPGGPSGQTDDVFVSLLSLNSSTSDYGFNISLPIGYPLGLTSDMQTVFVQPTIDGYVCRATAGSVDIAALDVPLDAGGNNTHGKLVLSFDLNLNCTSITGAVVLEQGVVGCVYYDN